MRSGELFALTLSDFDFSLKTVSINKNYARQNGEDLILTPKTEKSKRIVSLPDFMIAAIKEYANKLIYCREQKPRLKESTWQTKENIIQQKILPYFEN